ncbi:MAG: hypothetical protein JNK87_24510, partial [Bryobacterales bacterium]|nr:hypothetical protein [Bryobacterales bacterium]
LTGEGPVWPTELGGVQVMVGNRAAPLVSVSPARIVAQVPYETPAGQVAVMVRRGESTSRAARIMVVNPLPAVPTKNGLGYGELAASQEGQMLRFAVSGLGLAEPRVPTGESGEGAVPQLPVTVHIGGLPVEASIAASSRLGEFGVTATVPDGALAGDVVTVGVANRLANFATLGTAGAAEVTFLRLPDGTPELRGWNGSDLRGGFLVASGARTAEGCWPSVLLDLRAQQARRIPECLTGANANAGTPVTPTQNGSGLAALVGPPASTEPGAAVSSKAMVWQPGKEAGMAVELPGAAVALAGGANGGFTAVLAGTPPAVANIDGATGEVTMGGGGGVVVGPGGGVGGAGGGGAVLNPLNLTVDAGGGLNKVLTVPVNAGQQQVFVVVGDDENTPGNGKVAILNPQGVLQSTRDFPEGWVPLVPPAAPANPGGGGVQPGGGGGPGGGGPGGGGGPVVLPGGGGAVIVNPLARFRLPVFFDGQTRTYFVLARQRDDSRHALIAFLPNETRVVGMPDGMFAAVCTNNASIASIETSRRLVVLGARTADRTFRAGCGAVAFLLMDLAELRMTAVPVPGAGQMNASGQVADINDFVLATGVEGDVVFVLDGVGGSAFRLDLPQGIAGFAQLQVIPAMELAVATARVRVNGDAGFVVFDLARVETRQLALPEGFVAAQLMGILPATRNLVARGNLANNAGSAYLIYDLMGGEILLPANPPGVVFVGNVPAQAPGPGQPAQPVPVLQRVNQKANTIEAITYGADRRQNGAMLVRVP